MVSNSKGFTLLEIVVALAVIGVLASIALPAYQNYQESARVKQAKEQIMMLSVKIAQYHLDMEKYPDSLADINEAAMLDPWGNPYQYTDLTQNGSTGKARKDHNLVPLNSDFDLYSMGKDGKSVGPVLAPVSQDDVLRAFDGKFIDLAKNL
jgi:general secretion pathway protein G